jgi:polysaccharide export outer membrane protein
MFDLAAIRAGRAENPEILPGDTVIIGLSRAKALLNDLLGATQPLTATFVAVDAAS